CRDIVLINSLRAAVHNSNGRHDDPPFSRLRNVYSTLIDFRHADQFAGPPLARLVARHEISRWWKIRQCFKAHGGFHRPSAKSAGPDMLNRWRQTDEDRSRQA